MITIVVTLILIVGIGLIVGGLCKPKSLQDLPGYYDGSTQHMEDRSTQAAPQLRNGVLYRRCERCDGYVEPAGSTGAIGAGIGLLTAGIAGAVAAGIDTTGRCLSCNAFYDSTNFPVLQKKAVPRQG